METPVAVVEEPHTSNPTTGETSMTNPSSVVEEIVPSIPTPTNGGKKMNLEIESHDDSGKAIPQGDKQAAAPVMLSLHQINLTDEGRLREDDNLQIVEDYAEVFQQWQEKGSDPLKYPFPPCGVYQAPDCQYIPTAGRHRCLAAKEAGVTEIQCIIFPSEIEAVWHGLGDNRKNSLRNSRGDLKKMISIALLKHADKSHRLIAEHIGCSPSYVDKIFNQLPTSRQLTPMRIGRDGKQRPVNMQENEAESPVAKSEPLDSESVQAPNLPANDELAINTKSDTDGKDSESPSVAPLELDGVAVPADSKPDTSVPDDSSVPVLPTSEPTVEVASPAALVDESPKVTDPSKGSFIKKFKALLKQLPPDDEEQLESCKDCVVEILRALREEDRRHFAYWLAHNDILIFLDSPIDHKNPVVKNKFSF